MGNIGLVDFEIIARNEPKLIKSLAEFICDLFLRDEFCGTNVFSFQTTKHLCLVFNPHGSIIDTLFRIYASSNTAEFSLNTRKPSEIYFTLNAPVSSSKESLDDANKFSETMKICREIGPELLAYCLLVTSKDNLIQDMNDYIYFIQIYGIINSPEDKESSYGEQSDQLVSIFVSFRLDYLIINVIKISFNGKFAIGFILTYYVQILSFIKTKENNK